MIGKREAINIILERVTLYTSPQLVEKLEDYLLGEEIIFSNQEILSIRFTNSLTFFNRLECFDEEGNFIPNDSGKLLENFTKLIIKPHGANALEFFYTFKYRYKFYDQVGVPASFVQKDLESKVRLDRNTPIPSEDIKRFLLDKKYMAYDYIDRYKLFESQQSLFTAFLLMLTILNSEKQLGKDSEKIREIYGKRVENIREAIEKIGVHLFRFIHRKKLSILEKSEDKRVEIVFSKLKKARELNVVLSNNLEAQRFLKVIIDKCGEQSIFLKNLIKVAIELDKDNLIFSCNSLNEVKSVVRKYGLDSEYELEYILREFFDKPRILQYTYGGDFRTITSAKLDVTKNLWEKLLKERAIRGLLLASRLLINFNISDEEKSKIIEDSENLIIEVYQKMFCGDTRYEIIFPNPKMKNFEFLKDESFDENISLIEDPSKTYFNELLENLPKAVIFMLEYSLVARNALKLFTILEKDIKLVSRVSGGFNLDGSFMLYKTIVGEEEFYSKMYSMGVGFDSLLKYFAKSYYKNPQEDFKFYNFAHNHKDEVYKTLKTIKFESNYDCERVIDLLYGKYHGFDNYAPLISLAKNNGTSIIKIIEEKLVNREENCREEIERLKIDGRKAFVEMATRLIRIWDNKKIGEDLKNISDIKEVERYLENYYPKKLEKLAPYSDEIDYSKVRIKDSQEFASERLIKFYITEYMGVTDFFILNSCKKIASLVEIEDLRELVKRIFDKWQAEGMKSKYRNILLPLTLLANSRDFVMLKELVTLWITKSSLIELLFKAIGLREDKNSLTYLDTISKKHKSGKIKNIANTILSEIAKRKNISLEELGDIMIPDFDFVDRVRYFDYGKRKIKAYLDGNLNISFYDESGKKLKSLPKASKKYDDNEELVKEYKEELKAIKKQLKNVVDIQKSKLFKSILLQRKWSSSTWQELFIRNVIMNIFAIGLIWEERDIEGKLLGRFRYIEDGSFTTVDEDEYELQENTFISPANLREIGINEIGKWKEQLIDYEITQPVEQLSLNFVQLSKGDMERKNIPFLNDRVINYYQLKKLSDEFGYYDKSGGYFLIEEFYYKDLDSGVVAVIVTDHCINKSNPLESQPIINIYFKKGKPLPLKEVPLKLFDYVMMTLGKVLKIYIY